MPSDNSIRVEIDPNAVLPNRRTGYDEDGYAQYGEVSLYDAIIAEAADRLVGVGEKILREKINEELIGSVQEEIDKRLPAIIEAAFAEEVETGDGFASSKKSIRTLIGERVQNEVKATSRGGYGTTVLGETFRKQVDHALSVELKAEVDAVKKQVRARVTEKAAELLATESLRAAGIR